MASDRPRGPRPMKTYTGPLRHGANDVSSR